MSLLALLKSIYPDDYRRVQQALADPLQTQRQSTQRQTDWYKQLQIYVTYPESFHQGDQAGFDQLTDKLDYIKDLGLNAIHILPFLASPQIDAGFDISDYYIIREDVGSNAAFDRFLEAAQQRNLAVFMDLVLNHISEEHRWFQQAVSGDRFYRNFFEHSLEKPAFIKRYSDHRGEWAQYQTDRGPVDIRIIFPEQCGEIPHWRLAKDNYWYYHTFYPQQLDVDWNNYHVFVTYAKILMYWAKKGLHFRLDAIPFVGKQVQFGQTETTQRTHMIVQALHQIVKTVAPDCAFLVEANQPIEKTKAYFGVEETQYRPEVREAELAYNFPLMNSLWNALITGECQSIIDVINQTESVPNWGGWVTFLRNHDELSLEYAPVEAKQHIYQGLIQRGLPFRNKHDVAGRTASLLGADPDRIVLAHFLLGSMPGSPAIIYGDEIGKLNDYEFMKAQTNYKRDWLNDPSIKDDTRDINRGWLDESQIHQPEAKNLYIRIQEIFEARLKHIHNFISPPKVSYDENLLKVEYKNLHALINLTSGKISIPHQAESVILQVGQVNLSEQRLTLEPESGIWLNI